MKKIKNSSIRKNGRRIGAMTICGAMTLGMCGNSVMAVEKSDMNVGSYYSDYPTLEDTWEASKEINQQIEEESIVLLKNAANTLPLTGVKNISVFGKGSSDFYYAGGGSGTNEGGYNESDYYTLYQSLEDAGYNVNPRLKAFYDNEDLTGTYEVSNSNYVNETDPDNFTNALKSSYARYDDAAVIVIGRTGSEGGDRYTGSIAEGNEAKHGLELTDEEIKLVQHVTENFDKVIVVLNTPQQIELGWVEDGTYGEIDAAIWVGHPGMNGAIAIGEVLNGTVNPSGRLADIYAKDFTKDPTYLNLVDNLQIENGTTDYVYYTEDGATKMYHSVEYEEDIYYGYRYYETRAYEESQNGNDTWYEENVVYPFGYGLSYTDFTWDVKDPVKNTDESGNVYYTVDVTVQNNGTTAGKDVVELYYTAPYTAGGIEKSYVVLGDFAKTDLLNPGAEQTLTLTLYEQDMASYDDVDANGNGHTGYELDGGTYSLKVMKNSHDVVSEKTVEIEAQNFDTDRKTGATVENRFTNGDNYDSFGGVEGDMTRMSRADFEGTFPTTPTSTEIGPEGTPVKVLDEETHDAMTFTYEPGSAEDEADEAWYDYYMSVDMSQWTQDAEVTVDFSELVGLDSTDEKWTAFMNQFTYDEMVAIALNAGYKTMAVERLGIPATVQADGPVAIKGQSNTVGDSGIQWACNINVAATWNIELAELRGIMLGNEAMHLGENGWYAPGLNLHRSPFGGRNFEYYAEDGYLCGKIAAAVVNGVQSKGIIAFIKHFAVNNQEEDRGAALPGMESISGSDLGLMTWTSEQNMRENYFKAFQMCVEDADARGLMTSMNQIGYHSNTNNYQLAVGVLRQEWGFQGFTVTDVVPLAYGNTYADTNLIARVGVDTVLGAGNDGGEAEPSVWDASLTNKDGGQGSVSQNGVQNDITYIAQRLSTQRILFATVNSVAMQNNLNLDAFAATGEISSSIGTAIGGRLGASTEELGTNDAIYEVASGRLPSGVEMRSTGELTGTPMESGDFTVIVKLTADGYIEKENSYTIHVANDLFEAVLENGAVGEEYAGQITSSILLSEGNELTFAVAEGNLPAGLTIAPDGTISGTPAEAGMYNFVIRCEAKEAEENEAASSSGSNEPDVYLLKYSVIIEGDGFTAEDAAASEMPVGGEMPVDGEMPVEMPVAG